MTQRTPRTNFGFWILDFRFRKQIDPFSNPGTLYDVVVDIDSQPWKSREKTMAGIIAATGGDPKAIVLGDFNTPPESKWYGSWYGALKLANNTPHRGFRETWCYGIPLLTLDQIWYGKGWEANWTEHSRHGSDHSRVKAYLLSSGG